MELPKGVMASSSQSLPGAYTRFAKKELENNSKESAKQISFPGIIPKQLGEGISGYFKSISNDRKYNYLLPAYKKLFEKWSYGMKDGKPELDYYSFAGILKDLAASQEFSDIEKAYIWTHFAINRGSLSLPNDTGEYKIIDRGIKTQMKDTKHDWNTPVHVIVGFDDPKHAGLANLPDSEITKIISEREDSQGWTLNLSKFWGANEGDKNASLATIRCFQSYLKGGFKSFAKTWIAEFIDYQYTDIPLDNSQMVA